LHANEFDAISSQIKELLSVHPLSLENIVNSLTEGNEEKRIKTIRWLLDNEKIKYDSENKLRLN